MARHVLVCIKAHTIPAIALGNMRAIGLGGVDLGEIPNTATTIPARTYQVGDKGTFSNMKDCQPHLQSGNWAYSHKETKKSKKA